MVRQQGTPRLFKRGPPAEVRLLVLGLAAIVLLLTDSQLRVLEPVHKALSTMVYPFQRAVLMPRDAVQTVSEWMNAATMIRTENEALQRQRIELSQVASHAALLAAENAQLRRLLNVTNTAPRPAVVVEVLYEPANGFNQHLVFNKGSQAGLAPGMPVIDEGGVVGQIVRVTPMTAEAALVTDKEISIPVQILRNGLRLIAFGGETNRSMEVRYLAANADIKEGDTIVTSGIGGLFPAGLPVATVKSVDRDTASGFARAVVDPLAHPDRYRHFLVLQVDVGAAEQNREESPSGESE